MRIALVITELDPGGAEKCLTQLACYLSDLGHEVRVFAIGPPPAPGQEQFVKQLESHKIQVAFGIGLGGVRSTRSFPKVIRWLRAELRKFAPDVVQSMLFHGNLLAALSVDRKRTAFFGGVRVRQPERWRWWLERWSARRMLKMVCVSEDVTQHCVQQERIEPHKLVTIPNGIDLQLVEKSAIAAKEWDWTRYGLPADARVLLFVGRLHPQKGIEELVARADDLLALLPQHHLVVVGGGPLESRLRAIAVDRVHIVGWQPNALTWMHRADVLLLPASYEGMPNVLLESMAAHLPFIAFDVDGVRQLLGDSRYVENQIAPAGDFNKFIALTHQMANDNELRAHCATTNYAQIEQHFQLKDQLAAYAELYARS